MSDTTVDLLVVGGGPAAHQAAASYRDNGGAGPILVVSDDDTAPYFRPSLSKELLVGETTADDLPLGDLDGVELRTGTTVTELAPKERTATVDGQTVTWQQCILATGAGPVHLPIPGDDEAHHLRSLASARNLIDSLDGAETAVVVGSGFIGCEVAVSLARRGLTVTLVGREAVPQAARLGERVGTEIGRWLRQENVLMRGSAEVTSIEVVDGRRLVHIDGGDPVAADVVLVAAGAAPRSELADDAGLPVEHKRVVVDEHMRTDVPGVLAAGDVAYARNAAAGRHLAVEHWDDAETMGGIAGTTAAGGEATWDTPPGFWTDLGEYSLQYTGWGDGFDRVAFVEHPDGGFTAWYQKDGTVCAVATYQADEDFEKGTELVRTNAPASDVPGDPAWSDA
ncbi:NAD(P)/FAD-dependent oxidoreductase [Pseudonocardia phyllosphaerae]|uniref:NAD(P)/FAD-dependent oxidoreductase n=1 Tax=Pseudonocardia phyllosphaerae TaxID=3390502 RepID=UPI00397C9C16